MRTSIGVVRGALALLAVVAGTGACAIDSQEAPPLTGPSGFAQSVTLTATPDQLPRDGQSQAVVTITVRNEAGQPVPGQRLSLAATAGTLSQSEVVTGSDGRATASLTAPPPNAPAPNVIDVLVTPVGGNADSAVTRSLAITLVGAQNTTAPTPSFTVTPAAPEIQQIATFDASATTDEGAPCTSCTYVWSFGDGTTRTGRVVQHSFATVGSFTVTLTVTDTSGSSASTSRLVTTAAVAPPTVAVPTWTPDPPLVDQRASFATTGTAASGHRIVRYAWDFGDGTVATTPDPTVDKTYTVPGAYSVTVTATDDVGQTARASAQVTVVAATPDPPVARFTVTPAQPRVGQQAIFDASSSTAGNRAVITRYTWNFGNGVTVVTSTPTTSHAYDEARVYAVTLTVTDNLGQTSTVGRQVTAVP